MKWPRYKSYAEEMGELLGWAWGRVVRRMNTTMRDSEELRWAPNNGRIQGVPDHTLLCENDMEAMRPGGVIRTRPTRTLTDAETRARMIVDPKPVTPEDLVDPRAEADAAERQAEEQFPVGRGMRANNRLMASYAGHAEAVSIVRALAVFEPRLDERCLLCDSPKEHLKKCPFCRACEWVAAHPERVDADYVNESGVHVSVHGKVDQIRGKKEKPCIT